MKSVEYEFSIFQDGEWQAGGTARDAETALGEAKHYEFMYSQDGSVEVKFYERTELSLSEMQSLA